MPSNRRNVYLFLYCESPKISCPDSFISKETEAYNKIENKVVGKFCTLLFLILYFPE